MNNFVPNLLNVATRIIMPIFGAMLVFIFIFGFQESLSDFLDVKEKPPHTPEDLLRLLFVVYCVWLIYPLFPLQFTDAIGQIGFSLLLLYFIKNADGIGLFSACVGWSYQKYICQTSYFGATTAVVLHYIIKNLIAHTAYLVQKRKQKNKEGA